ncbi:MAG TPA: prepilin-type N-terminal cleavage/methylation domain-containing protein [Enterobacteriaceae bacterium]|nr:prepilin-type N-terminal cleavage/methylation domain-containing protein [Enterobacteriaceae bacterium]
MNLNHRSHGFSLIEVMVVLVIIGIATTAITVSVAPNPADTLRLDARELALRLTAAQQEVRVDGRVIAWQPQGDGYRFSRGIWVNTPGSVVPRVSVSGRLDTFARDDLLHPRRWKAENVIASPAKPLLLTAEWPGQPLMLELRSGPHAVRLERDATGTFRVP